MDDPAAEAQRRAESLVRRWHRENKTYCGGGLDWQAKKALIIDITAALTGPLAQIECMKDDAAAETTAAAPKPPKRAAAANKG